MKKAILLFSLILLTATFTFADGKKDLKESTSTEQTCSIQGKIVDKSTGEPLTGALVKIEGSNLEVYTDFEGNFTFQNMTPGVVDLKVSLISYKENLLKDINLSAGHSSVIEIAIDN
ncbi:MAG: carboxypeptidase-like regulatory domain-containing protein [Bacteroidetes bacterium]|nr:carboxypeptidase-like regulatory domain-containing protein [Bacteroidota bacterium]